MAASTLSGPLYATAATSAIGLSVAVSKLLIHYPVLSAQAVRYAIGATALLAVARLRRQRLPRPTSRDLALLLALGASGLAGSTFSCSRRCGAPSPPRSAWWSAACPCCSPSLGRRWPAGRRRGRSWPLPCWRRSGAGVVQDAGKDTAAGLAAVPTWTMPAAAHSFSDSTRNPVSAVS